MILKNSIESDGTLILTVQVDSLDRVNAPEFRSETTLAIAATKANVEVDCESLEFIDSSGLGAFLHIHNSLPESRRPVCLKNVGTKVLTILELMQVDKIFTLVARKL